MGANYFANFLFRRVKHMNESCALDAGAPQNKFPYYGPATLNLPSHKNCPEVCLDGIEPKVSKIESLGPHA